MSIKSLLARLTSPTIKSDRVLVMNKTTPSSRAVSDAPRVGMAQLDGVDFQDAGIEFADRAKDNETAIRSSLVYFKHRWPGRTAIPEGDYEFRSLARRIAAEVGVPAQGEREVASKLSDTDEANANDPNALTFSGGPKKLNSDLLT